MSEYNWTDTELVIWIIVIGFMASIIGFIIGYLPTTLDNKDITKTYTELKQLEIDCKIQTYYYIDEHRKICDKIGVTP